MAVRTGRQGFLRRLHATAAVGRRTVAAALVALFAVMPAGAQRWASVSVGDDHACALDVDGRAFCWGYNHSAQLGARTETRCGIVGESGHRSCYPVESETRPVAAGGGVPFASIGAGDT
jgi:alpha-tubulin suppressor-like RCC1 family protein